MPIGHTERHHVAYRSLYLVTHLRKLMLEELQRRNYSQTTVTGYIRTVADFAKYFQRPPD